MFRLLPREESFFDLLEAAAVNALATARLFRDMVEDYRNLPERVQKITDAEHAGDRIIHQIMDKLNKTFVTPIDREDIHALATEIDDIVDAIEVAADRMILYRIKEPTPITISLVRVLVRCCEEVATAIPLLRSPKQMKAILSHGIEINRLENEADSLSRAALEALFADPKDALEVLKWKEVYSTLEEAIDMTENVADVLHGIVIKNA
jgi:predicted phosphate transport protein (TIGR00153 family)